MTTRDWNRINRALERAPEERLDFFRQLFEPWPAGEAAALLTTGSGFPRMSAVAGTGALRHSTPTFNADLGRYRILKRFRYGLPGQTNLGDYFSGSASCVRMSRGRPVKPRPF